MNKYKKFISILKERQLSHEEEFIREFLRVKLTSTYIYNKNIQIDDKSNLFSIMKEVTNIKLGYFPGDDDLFYFLFNIGKDIDLIEFIEENYTNLKKIKPLLPEALTKYANESMENESVKNILITDTDRINLEGIKYFVEKNMDKKITLLSEDNLACEILKLYLERSNNIEVIYVSSYENLNINEKYDLILSSPLFNTTKYESSKEPEIVAIKKLLNYISDNGHMKIIVPAKFTFAGDEHLQIRKHIIDNYNVDSIYMLPEETYKPYASIKTYIVSISNIKQEYLRVGKLGIIKNKVTFLKEKEVPMEVFSKFPYWRIDLYVEESIKTFLELDNKFDRVRIKEIAEVFRGKSIMKHDVEPGNIYVLNISDIEDGEIIFDNMETIEEEERKVKKYELEDGDLVLTCRGTVNKFAVYRKKDDKVVIASANIIVVRFKKHILGDYAKIVFESPIGILLIKSLQRGTTVMNINPSDIEELPMYLVPIDAQEKSIREYKEFHEEYKNNIKKAQTRWSKSKKYLHKSLYNTN
jgi:hypothetical protein